MPELPTGTVTFLFSDIEGSTALLERHGKHYAEVLAEHRRAVREACSRNGGVEVDTQGDAFFVAFASASAAVAAAAEAQARLAVPVRMGIHTGEPALTPEGYVGLDVHRAARICSAGHGGQVLVSQTTRDLVAADLLDLGEHRLKDFGRPVRLFQLGEHEFPPLRSLNQSNLPAQPSPLVGRDEELADVLRLLRSEGARLVTITGPGGVGKTRFAVEVAEELAPDALDGVWFVDLSALRDPALVQPAVASTVGAAADPADQIAGKSAVLVLDNFEQVAEAGEEVGRLVENCPSLRVVVTSREPLHLRTERRYPLRPLSAGPAVELFRQRAAAFDPGFDAPHEPLAEICSALDHLPLAIELAAARTTLFSPQQLLERLETRLSLLASRSRDVPERQRTLRAAIEWSYGLLVDAEQQLFRRISIFAGGFTLDAAESVCGADVDVLESLVDKNLVRREGERFGVFETIREFAAMQLEESGEHPEIAQTHGVYYCALAERSEPDLTGVQQSDCVRMLAAEHENIRAAFEVAERTAPDELLRGAAALVIFWYVRSLYHEGAHWLERALQTEGGDEHARAKALWGLGLYRMLQGDVGNSRAPLEEALALAERLGDESTKARAQNVLGLLALFTDDLAGARSLFESSVELSRRAGDAWTLADALGTLASIYPFQGDLELGEGAGLEGVAVARENDDEHGLRMSLFGLGLTYARSGDHEQVEQRAAEGLDISRALGDLWFTSYFLWLLGDAALAAADFEAARKAADEAVSLAERIDSPLLLTCALELRARVDRDDERALADAEAAVAAGARGGVPKSYVSAALSTCARLLADHDGARARALAEEAARLADDVGDAWARARADAAIGG